MGTLLGMLGVIILSILWASIRSSRISNDRFKKLKTVLHKINKLVNSNTSCIYLYDFSYNDARKVMEWFYQIQNLHLSHPQLYKKPGETGEMGELIKKFKAKENPYRSIKNSESFLLQINGMDYLIILSPGQPSSASTLLEIEKVASDTPLRGVNPSDSYTSDWNSISRQYREKQHYICQDCGVDLSGEQSLLHTHHKNRDKGDNRENNLIALCAGCHKKQPYHEQRLSVPESDLKKIDLLRKQQGLKP